MAMSSISRKEYFYEMQKQYRGAKRHVKSSLLDEAELFTGLHRKAIIRILAIAPKKSAQTGMGTTLFSKNKHIGASHRGYNVIYDKDFHDALIVCWHAENCICAERLQPFLAELVPRLEELDELYISANTRLLLLSASISTVSRHLLQAQRRTTIPLGTTKPGSLIKSQIAVRKGRWQDTEPGWLESDTVAHGGDSAAGQFIYTYNFIDIASGWCELVATLGKGERPTVTGLDDIRKRVPFPVLGIDSDNGAEYINYHLMHYCKKEGISFTRSRPYHKNDNAHVEQKNWEAVRKMVGYAKYDTNEQLDILNELYSGPLRLYLNYFQPTRKRKVKYIDTASGTIHKKYFEAKTPYQRIAEHPNTTNVIKDKLQFEYQQLNPVKLLAEIRTLLERLNRTL